MTNFTDFTGPTDLARNKAQEIISLIRDMPGQSENWRAPRLLKLLTAYSIPWEVLDIDQGWLTEKLAQTQRYELKGFLDALGDLDEADKNLLPFEKQKVLQARAKIQLKHMLKQVRAGEHWEEDPLYILRCAKSVGLKLNDVDSSKKELLKLSLKYNNHRASNLAFLCHDLYYHLEGIRLREVGDPMLDYFYSRLEELWLLLHSKQISLSKVAVSRRDIYNWMCWCFTKAKEAPENIYPEELPSIDIGSPEPVPGNPPIPQRKRRNTLDL